MGFSKVISLIFVFICFSTYGQMTVTDLQGNPIQDGSTVVFSTTDLEDAKFHYVLGNSSTSDDINILIEVVSFTNTDGTNCQLCVQPLCFFAVNEGQSYPNNPINLAPNSDNGPSDYFSNTNAGDGTNYPMEFVLRFYQVDDSGQEVGNDITVTYQYIPEGFSNDDFNLADMGISIHNTLVSDDIRIESTTNAQFQLYGLNARLIDTFNIGQGTNDLDLSDLSTGQYMLIFRDEQGRRSSTRILKQ